MSSRFLAICRNGDGLYRTEVQGISAPLVEQELRQQGTHVLSVRAVPEPFVQRALDQTRQVLRKETFDTTTFCAQLQVLLNAGMTVIESLRTLTLNAQKPTDRAVIQSLTDTLEQGVAFGPALSRQFSFEPILCAMVGASEQAAGIRESLAHYLSYVRQRDALTAHLKSAMLYPAFLLGLGALVIGFLLWVVVPRFSSLFHSMGDELPLTGRLIVAWGDLVTRWGNSLLLTGLVLASTALYWLVSTNAWERVKQALYRLGPLGNQLRAIHLARLYRTLSLLLSGGVDFKQAVSNARAVIPSAWLTNLSQVEQAIASGQTPSVAMSSADMVTPVTHQLIVAGESSGELARMLDEAANFLELQTRQSVDQVTKLAEPVLMTVIGLIIGVIVVMMYMPIFELAGAVR